MLEWCSAQSDENIAGVEADGCDLQYLSIILVGGVQTRDEQCEFEVVLGHESFYKIDMFVFFCLQIDQLWITRLACSS